MQFEKRIYLYNIDEEQRIGRYVGSVKAFYQGSSKGNRVIGGSREAGGQHLFELLLLLLKLPQLLHFLIN